MAVESCLLRRPRVLRDDPSWWLLARGSRQIGSRWEDGVTLVMTGSEREACPENGFMDAGVRITPRFKRSVPECWPACAYGP